MELFPKILYFFPKKSYNETEWENVYGRQYIFSDIGRIDMLAQNLNRSFLYIVSLLETLKTSF